MKAEKTLAERATVFMQEEAKLLEKHGLARRAIVTFPKHAKVPFLGHVGVALLKWSGGVLDTEFGLIIKK